MDSEGVVGDAVDALARLTTGNLVLVRAAARGLPQAPLDDALRIALLMAPTSPTTSPPRSAGSPASGLERPTVGFDDLTHLLAAFEALPAQPSEAWAALTTICARHGIPIASPA